MTDPIRPDGTETPAGTAPAPEPSTSEGVADPALAALVTDDTVDADTVTEAVATPGTVVTAPPAAPAVGAPPPSTPPVVAVAPAPVVVGQPVVVAPRRSALSTVRRIVAFLFGILQALLILRIVLLLLNANQDDDIVAGILGITQPFIDPFMGMFQLDSVTGDQGSVLDIAAIVALVAWTLIETLILSLLRIFDRPAR